MCRGSPCNVSPSRHHQISPGNKEDNDQILFLLQDLPHLKFGVAVCPRPVPASQERKVAWHKILVNRGEWHRQGASAERRSMKLIKKSLIDKWIKRMRIRIADPGLGHAEMHVTFARDQESRSENTLNINLFLPKGIQPFLSEIPFVPDCVLMKLSSLIWDKENEKLSLSVDHKNFIITTCWPQVCPKFVEETSLSFCLQLK